MSNGLDIDIPLREFGRALLVVLGLWFAAHVASWSVFQVEDVLRTLAGVGPIDPVAELGLTVTLTGLGFAVTAGSYLFVTGHTDRIDIRVPSSLAAKWGLGVSLIVLALITAVTLALAATGHSPTKHGVDVGDNPVYLIGLLLPVLLVGIPAEELLYRVAIQGRLREVVSPIPAIGLATGVYMLPTVLTHSHLSLSFVGVLSISGLIGIGAGVVYEKTGNLWAASAIHGVYDGILILLLYLTVTDTIPPTPFI